ncbi:hypothetical protein D3C72_1545020 [compost metagenome]
MFDTDLQVVEGGVAALKVEFDTGDVAGGQACGLQLRCFPDKLCSFLACSQVEGVRLCNGCGSDGIVTGSRIGWYGIIDP